MAFLLFGRHRSVSKTLTDTIISDVVDIVQTNALTQTSSTKCSNELSLNGCHLSAAEISQRAVCVSSVTAAQDAMNASKTDSAVQASVKNRVTSRVKDTAIAIGMTSTEQSDVTRLSVQLATEVQQKTIASCFQNATASNTVTCSGGTTIADGTHIDQQASASLVASCAQKSSQNSDVVNRIHAIVDVAAQRKQTHMMRVAVFAVFAAIGGLGACGVGGWMYTQRGKVDHYPATVKGLLAACVALCVVCSFLAYRASKA